MLLCYQVKLRTQPRSCRHGSPSSTPWPLLGAHPWEGQISAQRHGPFKGTQHSSMGTAKMKGLWEASMPWSLDAS